LGVVGWFFGGGGREGLFKRWGGHPQRGGFFFLGPVVWVGAGLPSLKRGKGSVKTPVWSLRGGVPMGGVLGIFLPPPLRVMVQRGALGTGVCGLGKWEGLGKTPNPGRFFFGWGFLNKNKNTNTTVGPTGGCYVANPKGVPFWGGFRFFHPGWGDCVAFGGVWGLGGGPQKNFIFFSPSPQGWNFSGVVRGGGWGVDPPKGFSVHRNPPPREREARWRDPQNTPRSPGGFFPLNGFFAFSGFRGSQFNGGVGGGARGGPGWFWGGVFPPPRLGAVLGGGGPVQQNIGWGGRRFSIAQSPPPTRGPNIFLRLGVAALSHPAPGVCGPPGVFWSPPTYLPRTPQKQNAVGGGGATNHLLGLGPHPSGAFC